MIELRFLSFSRLPVLVGVWLRSADTGRRVHGEERQVLFGATQAHLDRLESS